jgi:hypothetical protein
MPKKRTTNRDHAKRQQRPMMEDEVVAAQLEQLVTPAVLAQEKYYRQLGMRDRILNLPLMVAAVLTLIWASDGSTLEAVFRKLDSLTEVPKNQLAGKIGVVIDLVTRLPVEIWFQEKATASDIKFESDILNLVKPQTLILLDRGFCHYLFWQQLIEGDVHLITRLNNKASFTVERVFTNSYSIRDRTVKMGAGNKITPCIIMRLVEIRVGKTWYSYLTSVLDPLILPPYVVADLYGRRWRIEEAFNTVKRLLGLSYIWTGSLNGIKLQLWATWLFYAVLVDLGDAIADEVSLPFDRISLEMIYRGLYHFYVAHHKGLANDPIKYFAAPENQDLGIVKSIRKPFKKLIIDPFPARINREGQFFFEPSAQTCLTTASVS